MGKNFWKIISLLLLGQIFGHAQTPAALSAESFIGRVVDVKAGDQLVIVWNKRPVVFQAAGIECLKGLRGLEALQHMKDDIRMQSVLVTPISKLGDDLYLADIRRINGQPISTPLLEKGLARALD